MSCAWAMRLTTKKRISPVKALPTKTLPSRVQEHIEAGRKVIAHNAQFELTIWNLCCVQNTAGHHSK
jgi:hypothetical protein